MGSTPSAFAENDINFAILPDLTDQDLKEIGVASLRHRRQLLRAITELVARQHWLRDSTSKLPSSSSHPLHRLERRAPPNDGRYPILELAASQIYPQLKGACASSKIPRLYIEGIDMEVGDLSRAKYYADYVS